MRAVSALLPPVPVLIADARDAFWLTPDGEVEVLAHAEARARAIKGPTLLCYAALQARYLGGARFPALDVLELFAFVRPATFAVPTPAGIAAALGLAPPADRAAEAMTLLTAAGELLTQAQTAVRDPAGHRSIAAMARGGWPWAAPLARTIGVALDRPAAHGASGLGLDVWTRIPAWEPEPPPDPPGDHAVTAAEAEDRLRDLVGVDAEARPEQASYAKAAAAAFAPRDRAGAPNVVLAEAGTGTGKTLGYVASASVWAEKNQGAVWVSTFTKNLQRQIDQELDRLYPQRAVKRQKVVVRKGRENYLCLLNLEEAASRAALGGGGIALGLVARWAEATRDGDIVSGDFPAWLADLAGFAPTLGLAHRRGECVYAACPHYNRCYVERSIRAARRADIVIANHALVLAQAGSAEDEDPRVPTRYVFDEGHHLFDAADSAYAAHLSGTEMSELRRWLRGEGRRQNRIRGLERRVGDLIAGDADAASDLAQAIKAASVLPGPGWLARIAEGRAEGAAEVFLAAAASHVAARSAGPAGTGYGEEAEATALGKSLRRACAALAAALSALDRPLARLKRALAVKLDAEAADLESATRLKIEAAMRSLEFRSALLAAWLGMLETIIDDVPSTAAKPAPAPAAAGDEADAPDRHAFVDWFAVERAGGRIFDVGLYRHWLDPTLPFARTVLARAHGAVITSATLRDRALSADAAGPAWQTAQVRTGTLHLPLPAKLVSVPSPFDYARATRIFVVTDVPRDQPDQIAAAYRELFLAAGGGALGLFTAIARLKRTYAKIADPLTQAGIKLLAQHIDPMDTGTLVDIFRSERDTCLLGTDAVRDGVDVPGPSLRLIVFDRVPWPRPGILHRARRAAFGGKYYDEMIVRLRLKQAFGRLIRRAGDTGVFVLLDRMTPSRLLDAFPQDVAVERIGLAAAVAATRAFLAP
jgi:ATP-dependent DNA helicase DinG